MDDLNKLKDRLMSPANSSRPIADLIADASSADVGIAGLAARELMHRHEECTRHTAVLVRQLSHRNAAIADLAFRTLERMGSSSVAELLAALPASTGRFRCDLLGLLSAVGDFDTIFPVLQNELEHGTEESRFWAANCLGRRVARGVEWPTDALATLERCVDLLLSCRRQPELMVHWPQARMTLKHLGKLPRDAT